MLDIKYIREHAEEVKKNCEVRNMKVDIDRLISLDDERKNLQQQIDDFKAVRNKTSKGKPSDEDIKAMKELGEKISNLEGAYKTIEPEYLDHLLAVPNLTHPDAPVGKNEQENVVVKTIGKKPVFDFEPKEHWDIGAANGTIEIPKAAEVSGSRFAYLKGELARMQFALVQLAFSVLTDEKKLSKIAKNAGLEIETKAFVPVVPPVMIRPDVMQKMGRLEPRDERYHIESDDLYLVGSAEHTLGPLHMGETVEEQDLPIRYIGYSTAFRREAGSYGKDTKGIFRVHQFDKLEIESLTTAEKGMDEQQFIMAIQQHLMNLLELPYQVVYKCTGDMGGPDYNEFDIETWMPGQGKYRETHTSDYMTDYQSRRLNTKVKKSDGKKEFVHMNDATVFAIGRTLVAIMENYQKEDGTIEYPDVLKKWM